MARDVIDAYAEVAGSTARFRREVEEVVRSYRHTWDVLAELLQNSVDAIRRRAQMENDLVGRVRIEIDTALNEVSVYDNGCGLTSDQVPTALAPNGSFKLLGQDFGYKGFGLTFVCFAARSFDLVTTSSGERSHVTMSGNIDWLADRTGVVLAPPVLRWLDDGVATSDESGTTVRVALACGEYQALFGAIAALDKMFAWAAVPKRLEYVLRTRTAVGCTRPLFNNAPDVPVTVEVTIDDGTPLEVPFRYLLPDEAAYVRGGYYPDVDTYVERFLDGLLSRDAKKFRGLRYSVVDQEVGTLRKIPFDALIFVCGRTGMTRLAREFDIDPTEDAELAELKLSTGVHLALGGMPSGISIEDWESGGSFEQRFFVLVDAALDLSDQLDSGRKGISRYFADLIVATVVSAISDKRFGPDRSLSLRRLSQNMAEPGSDPTSDSLDIASIVAEREGVPLLTLDGLTVRREPVDENEVIALFFELCARNIIIGYELLYLTQFYRYDAAFAFGVELTDDVLFDPLVPEARPLGLGNAAREAMGSGKDRYSWKDRKGSPWIVTEFKPRVEDLLGDRNQRVSDIELLITWSFNPVALAGREATLLPITPQERRLHSVTHRLSYEGSDCDCIVLSEVLNTFS